MEAEAIQVWTWLGREAVEFGVRWIVVGATLLGFGGWFGWRYRELKKRVSDLESQPPVQVNVNVPQTGGGKKPPLPGVLEEVASVARYLPDEDLLRVGTAYGPLAIRLNHKKTVDDILDALNSNGVLRPLDEGEL